jgi:hypothetical protein
LHFLTIQAEADGDEDRLDAIMDTMDCICGGPWAKGRDIFSGELDNKTIDNARKELRELGR